MKIKIMHLRIIFAKFMIICVFLLLLLDTCKGMKKIESKSLNALHKNLVKACKLGDFKKVKELVEDGANVNFITGWEKRVPAYYAGLRGFYGIVKYLIHQGSKSEDIYSHTIFRRTLTQPNQVRNLFYDQKIEKMVDDNKKKEKKLYKILDVISKTINSENSEGKERKILFSDAIRNIKYFLIKKNQSTPHLDRIALNALVMVYQTNKCLLAKNEIYKFFSIISFSNLQFLRYKDASFFAGFSEKKIKDYNGKTIQEAVLEKKHVLLLFPEYIALILLANDNLFGEDINLKRLLISGYLEPENFKNNKLKGIKLKGIKSVDPIELQYLLEVKKLAIVQKSKGFLVCLQNLVFVLFYLNKKFPSEISVGICKFLGVVKNKKKNKLCTVL